MKKVLLATTVLAAVSVATPVLAEVTVSGYYRFGWSSYSDDSVVANVEDSVTETYTDSEIHIKFSKTTDSGLTYGATFELEGDAAGVDESSLSLSGDFGTVILGGNDYAHDSFITWAPTHHGAYTSDSKVTVRFEDEAAATDTDDVQDSTDVAAPYYAGNASYNDDKKITYMSPDFSGFKFGVSATDDAGDDNSNLSAGLSFSGGSGMMDDGMMGGVTYKITANMFDDGDGSESTAFGAKIGLGDMTFTASSVDIENGTVEASALQFGFGYNVSDALSLGLGWSDGEEDSRDHELEVLSVSMQYTIAPGLVATAALNSYDASDNTAGTGNARSNDGTKMVFALTASF